MQTYALYFENVPAHCDAFRSIIDEMKERVNTDPVRITYEERDQGDFRMFRFQSWCMEEYDAETIEWARAFISLAVAEWVIRVKEPEVMEEIAGDLIESEQLEEEWPYVIPFVQRLFAEGEEEADLLQATTRKARIYRKVRDYLEDERELNVLGFVRFRLQEHWNELFELIETGLDDYLEDRQYQEFVDLLRFLSPIRKPSRKSFTLFLVWTNLSISMTNTETESGWTIWTPSCLRMNRNAGKRIIW